MASDAELYAEIGRHFRRRMSGVYLLVGAAAVLSLGVAYSQRMMHPDGLRPAEGVIVAVGTDPNKGETTMTTEFVDAQGVKHTDTQTAGYHYARGEPQVGERIEYLYGEGLLSDFYAVPRADRFLQWLFGVPAALMFSAGALAFWLILRQRRWRRWLVQHGQRVDGAQYEIRERTVVLPGGAAGALRVHTWRLQARRFDPAQGEYVDCSGEWQQPPVPAIGTGTPLPPIFVDPRKTARYWLPTGELAGRK